MSYKRYSFLILVIFLIYSLSLVFASRTGFPNSIQPGHFWPYLSDKPITEDGYYMLTVSRNIAMGNGISYNNGIETTGVHPLSTFIYAAISKVVILLGGNKYSIARTVIIYSIILLILFGFLNYFVVLKLFPLANRPLALLVSFLTSILNLKLFVIFANGLESGIYILFLSVCVLYTMVYINGKQTFRTIFVLGILFGLTLLARIDFLVIALCLIFVLFIKKLLRLREAVIVVLLMLLISSPWFIYVHSVTGSFLTSSAEQTTSIFHLVFYKNKFINFFNSLLLYLTPFVYLGSKVFLSYMLSIAFILVIYYLYKVSRFEIKKLSNVSMIGHWFVSFFFILIIYLIFSDADYFYLRYFSILSVLALPLYNVFFVYLLNDKYKKLLPVAIAAVIIAFLVQAFLYFNSGKIVDHLAIRPGFIEKNISSNAIVASWQSGVTGYYCSSVYNLDGKMNYKCLEYSKRGKLEKYLDSLGVNVLIGWNEYIDSLEENNSNKIWKVYSKNIGDNHTGVYIRKGSESSVLKNYPKE